MLARRYAMPWRHAYEVYAGLGWSMALVFFLAVGVAGWLPRPLALPLSLACFAMGLLRLAQALRVLVLRASLAGRGIQVIGTDVQAQWCSNPGEVFLGFGFGSGVRCIRSGSTNLPRSTIGRSPSRRALSACSATTASHKPYAEIGLAYIHGVEPREVALHRPLQNFEGGTLLVGTTQSGKGVALANLVTQAVRRGDVVIVINPKNSRRLKRVVERACQDWREPNTFMEFHPAFPEVGVRLDFTFNRTLVMTSEQPA